MRQNYFPLLGSALQGAVTKGEASKRRRQESSGAGRGPRETLMTLSGWQPKVWASLGVLASPKCVSQDLTAQYRLPSLAAHLPFHMLAGHLYPTRLAAYSACLPACHPGNPFNNSLIPVGRMGSRSPGSSSTSGRVTSS